MGTQNASIRRHPDWPLRLSSFIKASQNLAFQWGINDCSLWVADAVLCLTGHDFSEAWRGRYKSLDELREIVENEYGGKVENIVIEALGDPIPFPRKAQRGDVVLVDDNDLGTIGIVDDTGRYVAMLSIDRGLARVRITDSMKVWHYG